MKIRNPSYVSPVAAFVAANKDAISVWLAGKGEFVTADDIRAAFPTKAAQLTDGMIAEICNALGLVIV